MITFALSGCFGFGRGAKPKMNVPVPEGLVAVSVPILAPTDVIRAGARVDILADLSGYNPFTPEQSPKPIDSKPVRIIGSSLVLAVLPGNELSLAVDHTEARYLGMFKDHGKFLSAVISDPQAFSPQQISEMSPILK
jgi:hypothetical protein